MQAFQVKKSHVYFSATVLLIVAAAFVVLEGRESVQPSSTTADATLEGKFAFLSGQHSNSCGLSPAPIGAMAEGMSLQGSCCSRMDFHRYSEQVEGLKKYAEFEAIPADPYDIPVSLANKLLGYQKTISLTPEQQAIYDKATKASHEGGPCCCKCWRWYAFEGLAKHLIVEEGFNAEQVAEVWDLEDGCGGSGHAHAENA